MIRIVQIENLSKELKRVYRGKEEIILMPISRYNRLGRMSPKIIMYSSLFFA